MDAFVETSVLRLIKIIVININCCFLDADFSADVYFRSVQLPRVQCPLVSSAQVVGGFEDGNVRVPALQVHTRADVRCEIRQTLWTCEGCSLTWTLLWLTAECTHA